MTVVYAISLPYGRTALIWLQLFLVHSLNLHANNSIMDTHVIFKVNTVMVQP